MCVVDAKGKVVREIEVANEPEVLVRYFFDLDFPVSRIGLEAGPLSPGLHAGLVSAGHGVVLLETRHVKAVLSAMTVKTRAGSRSCCGWDGIAWFIRSGCAPRTSVRAHRVLRMIHAEKSDQLPARYVGMSTRLPIIFWINEKS